jgi:hypothetical protein
MKYLLYKRICLSVTLLCCVAVQAQWTLIEDLKSDTYYTSLAFNKSNVPYILHGEGNSYRTTVQKLENNTWQTVGNPQFSNNHVFYPKLAIANNGTVYTAFSEWSAGYPGPISVMKFDGTAWIYVGNRFMTPSASNVLSLATDSSSIPYIAIHERGDLNKLSVMKFTGVAWEYVGTHSFSPRNASYVSLAFDRLNNLYVAFKDSANKASVMKYDGSIWSVLGSFGLSAGTVYYETPLAIDSNNVPYVAYTDMANGNKATVKKFDGTQWMNAGPAAFSSTQAYNVQLVISGNNVPYVGYKNSASASKATVMKLEGGTWSVVGAEAFTPNPFLSLSLAVNKYGTPHIATDSGSVRIFKYINPPYRFIGSGNWNDPANWSNNLVPPDTLPGDYSIIIDPAQGECILNETVTISAGASLMVQPGKRFIVNGSVIIL